ncbi:Patched domain-containing protein 3 [Armadillidium nasatum]|uniref:Patched domain-containing protein 3 n=1 Tax=Armadillidium nasatum TaxID=96803 RepID=A0A5N5T800_9CRUS|nr:Patched domain-containing protein 3 [Armadillidium nasatum]
MEKEANIWNKNFIAESKVKSVKNITGEICLCVNEYNQKDILPQINIQSKYKNDQKSSDTCKGCNPLQKFHEFLTLSFYKLGTIIALYPSYFIIFPIFICLLGMTGFQRMVLEEDSETLYYPDNGIAIHERERIEHYFHLNSSAHFLPYYVTRIHGFARVLIEPKDKGSIFRKFLWKEILEIDQAVKNISITYDGRDYDYKDMCAVWNKNCSENAVLDLYDEVDAIENKTMKINYPLMIFPFVIPMFFGGITLDQNRLYIKSATAINLAYFLRVDTPEQIERASIWEQEFISTIGNMTFEHLHVSYSAARSIQDATNETPQAVKPFIPIVVLIMILFSVGNTMMFDWVRSKVYLGLIGLSSAALATGASFGYLMYFGIANSGINNIIPFLMIGIGLDDMFVVLAAWRRTPVQDSVVKRLGNTYADAGISVLITSLTNMVSFLIGTTAPIYSIRLFSLYTDSKEVCYSFWCSGGINPSDPWNPIDNQQNSVMIFFRDYFGRMLTKKYVKYYER